MRALQNPPLSDSPIRREISSVVVHSFSRFARSTTHLLNALNCFKSKGVHFVSISERIDTNSAVGVAIFSILAAIAHYAKSGVMLSDPSYR